MSTKSLFNQELFCQTEGSAGFDITSEKDYVLAPGQRQLIDTNLFFKDSLPSQLYMAIVPRSGLAYKHGITVLNSPATIDADYTGEIKVLLINHGEKDFAIKSGDKIAQGIIFEHKTHDYMPTVKVERGDGGFGSTGV